MSELGKLSELPQAYRDALTHQNLAPLWPSLRSLLPPTIPARQTQPTMWPYAGIRPLLMQAGALTPIEKAERRVLVLANPGHGLERMQASAAIYLGMQLLLPGEWAPSHRHTPNAVRMVVEGVGAWTTVEGEKLPMARGDLILTPSGLWHEHGHDGDAPVVWLDVLDLPLVHYLEASYHVNGARQVVTVERAESAHPRGGLLPTAGAHSASIGYPMLRYAWRDTKSALEQLGRTQPANTAVQLTYVNPTTGSDAQNILGYHALMLRPGEVLSLSARSPASVFHVIEGGMHATIAGEAFEMGGADTCCAPGYSAILLRNRSAEAPCFVFVADESPLHRKLGIYEVRV